MNLRKLLPLAMFAPLCIAVAQTNADPVLLTIDGTPVHRSEFEYIYNKNNSETSIDKKTRDEYMELFVNFKLKVAEAKAQGLDTAQSFVQELAGYRRQLAKPYMTDSTMEDYLLHEAYERKLEDVEVSHIAIKLEANATAADTLAAYNKAMRALQRVTTGTAKGKKKAVPESFATVAREMSDDPTAANNGGYLGWMSVFRTVYPFETAVYTTPIGYTSLPFRTPFGYHIVKVTARRPSQGEVRVAHIMTFTDKDNDSISMVAKQNIDSLYQRVLAGDDFGKLAQQYSQDRGTSAQNGELPWFGTGRMVPEFEKAAFALQNVGDVAAPVRSEYGWHIIKLLEKRGVGTFEANRAEMKRMLDRDTRHTLIDKSFIENCKKAYNCQVQKESLKDFYALAAKYALDDSVFTAKAAQLNKPLLTYAGKTRTQADFAAYIKQNPQANMAIPGKAIDDKMEAYVADEMRAQEDSQLENKYTDFRNLMAEYHDGILLFDISNREVWERASQDTVGLATYFAANKSDYTWQKPHYKGRIVYCKDENTLKLASKIAKNTVPDSLSNYLYKRLNDSIQYVRIEKVSCAQGDSTQMGNQLVEKTVFGGKKTPKMDKITLLTANNVSNSITATEYPYVLLVGKVIAEPETYEDVRGLVTADYQEYLETTWVKQLHEKHKVEIDAVLWKKMRL